MVRASDMARQAAVLLKALKAYPAGAAIPADDVKVTKWWRYWESNYLDSRVDGTHLTWSSKDIRVLKTAEEYRLAIQIEASITNVGIKSLDDAWKRFGGFGDHVPYYNPEAVAIFDAIERMDPKTGHIPGDVPSELRPTQ